MNLSLSNSMPTVWYRFFTNSLFIGLLLSLVPQITKAQSMDIDQLSATVLTETIAFPFTRYSPVHPGFELGARLKTSKKANSFRSFHAYIGGFYHQRVQSSVYLRGEYQHSLLISDALQINFPMGLGYVHTFYPADMYELQGDGTFETVKQTGKPRALINLGIGMTYTGFDAVQPFVKQELGIETPFANGVPLAPHSFLKLGINFNLN